MYFNKILQNQNKIQNSDYFHMCLAFNKMCTYACFYGLPESFAQIYQ